MSSRQEEHVVGGGKIRSVILGLTDGLISTFTLLVGVTAATLAATGSNSIVILTGFAAMVSGAINMGLGEYISSKSKYNYIKNELKKERAEIELFPELQDKRDALTPRSIPYKNSFHLNLPQSGFEIFYKQSWDYC